MSKILIITPDYPPKLGGLSTFTVMCESCLKSLGHEVELFVWSNLADLRSKQYLNSFDYIISIHFLSTYFLRRKMKGKFINFIHGSEITFYSSNILKRMYKILNKKKMHRCLEKSYKNIFVSHFTKLKLEESGFLFNSFRDNIFHNCIDVSDAKYINKSIEKKIIFSCFVRNVPHKNILGVEKLVSKIASWSDQKIELYITSDIKIRGVEVFNVQGCSEEERQEIYKKSTINLLLSVDHSHIGHYEGFGLTVLESGIYGVPTIGMNEAGLRESIHHNQTGWLIDDIENLSIDFWNDIKANYQKVSEDVYDHTLSSHHTDRLKEYLEYIL